MSSSPVVSASATCICSFGESKYVDSVPLCSGIPITSGSDSLVVRASASVSKGRGFAPRPCHTKGVKNGTGSSLADARNQRVVLGRYKNAGRYLLHVMSQ